MAKLKDASISETDLREYLDGYSDFSFEIRVLKQLTDLGFSCEHAGSYTDPTSGKVREFDIRATKEMSTSFIRLAVECKNLRQNFPLLISCLPRRGDEAFHDIVFSFDPERYPIDGRSGFTSSMTRSSSFAIRINGDQSLYPVGGDVGKSCDQVGRTPGGDITSGDSDVYAKWSQALTSANDLTYRATQDGPERTGSLALSLVLPILIVPNGRLWAATYDERGNLVKSPRQVERCSYFVNLHYSHRHFPPVADQNISHLEFLTEQGLVDLVDSLCRTEADIKRTFATDYAKTRVFEQLGQSEWTTYDTDPYR